MNKEEILALHPEVAEAYKVLKDAQWKTECASNAENAAFESFTNMMMFYLCPKPDLVQEDTLTFQTITPVKKVAWAHRCDWCDEEIPAGSPATAYGGGEGNFHWRVWRHPECEAASLKVDAHDLECCSAGSFRRGTDEQK